MNKSPRTVEDLILDNEALLERTETLQKRNNVLSFEVQNLQEIVSEMEDDYKELQAKLSLKDSKLCFKDRMLEGVKLNNSALTLERNNLLKEIQSLKTENEELRAKNTELKKDYDEFYEKEYMVRIEECNRLWGELFDIKHMGVWEFANKYCTPEQQAEAGKAFARELLGKPMTPEEIAIDEAENGYKPYNGDDL